MLPAGKYQGSIKDAVLGESSNGTPQMILTWSINGYYNPDQQSWESLDPPEERRTFWSFSDAAAKYAFDKLKALGFNGNMDEPAFDVDEAELKCEHEEYQGKDKERWDLANWGGEVKAAAPDKVKRVAALYRNYLSSTGAKAPTAKPAVSQVSSRPKSTAPAAAKPAPSRPAPSAPSGVATAEPATRDSAWAALVAIWGDKYDDAGLAEQWAKIIKEVGEPLGADEADFGPDEWQQVTTTAEIPF